MTGVISRVFLTRGFGFIAGEDGEAYFLHINELREGEWEEMRTGVCVEFLPTEGGRGGNGRRATEVRKA